MNRRVVTFITITGALIAIVILAATILSTRNRIEIIKLSPNTSNSLTMNTANGVAYYESDGNIVGYWFEDNQQRPLLAYNNSPYSVSVNGTYIARQNNGKSFDIFRSGQKVETVDALSLAWISDDTYVYFNPINPKPEGNNTGIVAEKMVGGAVISRGSNQLVNNLLGFTSKNVGVIIENELDETPATRVISPSGQDIFKDDSFWVDFINPIYPQNSVLGVEPTLNREVGELSILQENGSVTKTGLSGSLASTTSLGDRLLFCQNTNSRTYFKTYDPSTHKTEALFDLPQVHSIYAIRAYKNWVIINSADGVLAVRY